MDANQTLSRAAALLEAETTLVLATADPDGTASAAPLFYLPDIPNLYWLSSPTSRHSRNIAGRPRVAAAVFAAVQDWRHIRGVQMEGEASAVDDPAERERVTASYRQKFGLGEEFDSAIAASTLYVFRPDWVRYLDNGEGFGFKEEWTKKNAAPGSGAA